MTRFTTPEVQRYAKLFQSIIWAGELKCPPLPEGYKSHPPSRLTRLRWWFESHRPYLHFGPCRSWDDDPWE
jgi:hypothetical protein